MTGINGTSTANPPERAAYPEPIANNTYFWGSLILSTNDLAMGKTEDVKQTLALIRGAVKALAEYNSPAYAKEYIDLVKQGLTELTVPED